ncbi:unnamed protein product [Merluccius merluccius]
MCPRTSHPKRHVGLNRLAVKQAAPTLLMSASNAADICCRRAGVSVPARLGQRVWPADARDRGPWASC